MTVDAKYIRKATGLKTLSVKHCDSTFDEIGDYDVIIAQSQKHGYGRGDHTFYSPTGGLYTVIKLMGLSIDAHTLTPAVGLAVHDAIKSVLGLETKLKWVNDVLYQDKKAAGILCRCPRKAEYYVGIGINYATDNAEFMMSGLNDAISLCAPKDKATEFCVEMLRNVRRASLVKFECDRYNELCDTIDKNVTFTRDGIRYAGYAESVDRDGSLIVRMGKATFAVDAGEVKEIRVLEKG